MLLTTTCWKHNRTLTFKFKWSLLLGRTLLFYYSDSVFCFHFNFNSYVITSFPDISILFVSNVPLSTNHSDKQTTSILPIKFPPSWYKHTNSSLVWSLSYTTNTVKYFDFGRTWRRLFQERVAHTKFDIYVFIFIIRHTGACWYEFRLLSTSSSSKYQRKDRKGNKSK